MPPLGFIPFSLSGIELLPQSFLFHKIWKDEKVTICKEEEKIEILDFIPYSFCRNVDKAVTSSYNTMAIAMAQCEPTGKSSNISTISVWTWTKYVRYSKCYVMLSTERTSPIDGAALFSQSIRPPLESADWIMHEHSKLQAVYETVYEISILLNNMSFNVQNSNKSATARNNQLINLGVRWNYVRWNLKFKSTTQILRLPAHAHLLENMAKWAIDHSSPYFILWIEFPST